MTLGQMDIPAEPLSPDPLRDLVIHSDLSPEKAATLAAQAAAAAVLPMAIGQTEVAAPVAPAATGASNPFAGMTAATAATFAFMAPKLDAKKLSPHVSLDTSDSEGIGENCDFLFNYFVPMVGYIVTFYTLIKPTSDIEIT